MIEFASLVCSGLMGAFGGFAVAKYFSVVFRQLDDHSERIATIEKFNQVVLDTMKLSAELCRLRAEISKSRAIANGDAP